MEGGITAFGNFMRQNSIKSLFKGKKAEKETDASMNPIPQLSPIANSVIARCSRILQLSTEDLKHQFETELPDHFKEPSTYARNLLEYGAYKALNIVIQRPDHLADKEFRRLTFDMMLAWEDPGTESVSLHKTASNSNPEIVDEEGGSLFYTNSTSMAIQVDDKKTVGPEAFARIAPACPAVADIITVHNLFYMLTSASGGRLHFLIYDKYLGSLKKVIKTAKSASGRATASNLQLSKGEIVLDVDGTIPTQPVLQHIGISAWPGITFPSGRISQKTSVFGLMGRPSEINNIFGVDLLYNLQGLDQVYIALFSCIPRDSHALAQTSQQREAIGSPQSESSPKSEPRGAAHNVAGSHFSVRNSCSRRKYCSPQAKSSLACSTSTGYKQSGSLLGHHGCCVCTFATEVSDPVSIPRIIYEGDAF